MADPGAGEDGRRRRLLVLGICAFSLFMTYLDSTILNVALPSLQRDLHASLSGLQWIVDAYMLVLASLLLLAGSTADRIGRRRVFTVGLLTFSAGSLLCSLAPNVDALIGFRALQAVGGSMLTPVSLSIVRTTFTDPGERARALGLWSGVFGLATACGPVVGGILVDLVGWRSVFWVNVPVGIAAFVLARRHVPESRADHPRRGDPVGQALVVVVLASATYAIIEGPQLGWTSAATAGLLAVAVTALAALVFLERRSAEPLLETRFFKSPPFAGANAIATLSFLVLAGFLFVNTLYLQEARGDSPLLAGLATLPVTAVIAVTAPLAGRLVARRGPRLALVVAGLLLMAGSAVLLVVAPDTPYLVLVAGYVPLGLGFGLVNPPVTNTAVTSMPPAQAGVASAVSSSARQLGNVLGVAVGGALLTSGLHGTGVLAGGPARWSPAAAAALSRAAHAPLLLGAACGLACAAVALVTTGRWGQRVGAAVYSDYAAAGAPPTCRATGASGAASG